MVITLEQLKDAAIDLPEEERAELAQFLASPLNKQESAAIRAEWTAEAKLRMANVKAGTVVGVPADEVLDNLLGADD